MRSVKFILKYFSSYVPKEHSIYLVILYLLKSKSVTDKISLVNNIKDIKSSLNHNDKLLLFYFYKNTTWHNIFEHIKINYSRIVTQDKYITDVIDYELDSMLKYEPKIHKVHYLFKHLINLPNDVIKQLDNRYQAFIFYSVRENLLSCKSRKEISHILNNDKVFRSLIKNEVIKYDSGRYISNKRQFNQMFNFFFFQLEYELNKKPNLERVWNIYAKFISEEFNIDKNLLIVK